VVVSPGWSCSGGWTSFLCSKTTTSGGTSEVLQLRTTSTHGCQTVTSVAGATKTNNVDPDPSNNSQTVTAPLN